MAHSELKVLFHKTRNRRPCDWCRKRKQLCKYSSEACERCIKLNRKCIIQGEERVRKKRSESNTIESPTKAVNLDILSKSESIHVRDKEVPNEVKPADSPSLKTMGITDNQLSSSGIKWCIDNLNSIQTLSESNFYSLFNDKPGSLQVAELTPNDTYSQASLPSFSDTPKDMTLEESQAFISQFAESYGAGLLQTYFTFLNPFLPVISGDQFHFMINHTIHENIQKYGFTLLGSIFLNSIRCWDRNEELMLSPSPDPQPLAKSCFKLLMNEFETATNNEESNKKSLQSCLLQLPQIISRINSINDTVSIVPATKILSIATFLVNRLGLNVSRFKDDLNSSFRNNSDIIARNNLWWAYYVEEKWFSFLTVRPSTINEGSFEILNEINSWPNLSYLVTKQFDRTESKVQSSQLEKRLEQIHFVCWYYFHEMLKITAICSDITAYWYTLHGNFHMMEMEESLKTLNEIRLSTEKYLEKVNNWWNLLDPEFKKYGQKTMSIHPISANCNLRIFYDFARVSIYKILIKKVSLCVIAFDKCESEETNPVLETILNEHLGSVLLEIAQLYEDHLQFVTSMKLRDLNSYWYPMINYQFCYFILFLTLLMSVSEMRRQTYQTDLFTAPLTRLQKVQSGYNDFLKNRSAGWDFLLLPLSLVSDVVPFNDLAQVRDAIESLKDGGIVTAHGIEHLLYRNNDQCESVDIDDDSQPSREESLGVASDMQTMLEKVDHIAASIQ